MLFLVKKQPKPNIFKTIMTQNIAKLEKGAASKSRKVKVHQ